MIPMNTILSDAELDELSDFLDSIEAPLGMEALDGFLAALICAPDLVMPSTYYPYIWGEYQFQTENEVRKYTDMIGRHWNSIVKALSENEVFAPVLTEDEKESPGCDWSLGFLSGLELSGQAWTELLRDEENDGLILPIFTLAHEHDADPEFRSAPIDDDMRERLIAGLSVFTPKIYEYFEPHRRFNADLAHQNSSFKRSGRKIGRNEPCPCGSGKKYKQCCGRN